MNSILIISCYVILSTKKDPLPGPRKKGEGLSGLFLENSHKALLLGDCLSFSFSFIVKLKNLKKTLIVFRF